MAEDHHRNETVTLVIGVALVALGVSALLNVTLFPLLEPLRRTLRWARDLSGPLTLIALGIAVFVLSRRGAFRQVRRGERLYRSRHKKMVAGVLGGLSDYFGVDVTVLRLVTVALALLNAWAFVLAYVVAAVVVPLEPADAARPAGTAPPPQAPRPPAPPGP